MINFLLLATFIIVELALSKPTNQFCSFNVSKSGSGNFPSVTVILNQLCQEDDGYKVYLLDQEHIEHLIIDNISEIFIVGWKNLPTIWTIDTQYNETILLKQGDLTLSGIEFQFQYSNDSNLRIFPSQQLILVSKLDDNYLTVEDCIFKSIFIEGKDQIVQINVKMANIVFLQNCIFKGIGPDKYSSITMINANNCLNINILNCTFQDAQISSILGAVQIQAVYSNTSIVIRECEFTNIIISNNYSDAALYILGMSQFSIQITQTNFTNCCSISSASGALCIMDSSPDNQSNDHIIANNIFTNNSGNYSGSIFFQSQYSRSNLNFNNNQFISNQNNQTKQIGRDSTIFFGNPPADWTENSTLLLIANWFNWSSSNAKKDSVHFEGYHDSQVYINISITLHKLDEKKILNKYIIAGIAGGSLLIVTVIISIIIALIVRYKKNKIISSQAYFERSRLIVNKSYRSI